MTQRERQTPDGGNGPITVPTVPQATSLDARLTPSAWETLFRGAPPARREELLALARARGVLYAHHLPDAGRDAASQRAFPAGALLNGRCRELPPTRPPAVAPHDTALDVEQREAVARALHTPDVCLITGVPGSGKSRVVAEILTRAAARGERVLFLAPTSAALDHVLAGLAHGDAVCPVRCLAADETVDRLPAAVRPLALDSRVRHFREHTVPQARAAAAAARRRVEAERARVQAGDRLVALAAARGELAARLAALDERVRALGEQVAAECAAAPKTPEVAAAHRAAEEAVATIEAREVAVRAEQAKVRAALDEARTDEAKLSPLEEAGRGYRLWSTAWWQARNQGDVAGRLDQLRARRSALEAELAGHDGAAAALARERAAVAATLRAAVEQFNAAEVARRSVGLEQERTEALAEDAGLTAEWAAALARVDPSAPASLSAAALPELQAAADRRLAEAEAALLAAERWQAAAEESAPDIAARLAATCDIVASTIAAVGADAHFGERTPAFDLLVLEEADRITETEFLRAARRAHRWVLVGETVSDREARGAGPALRPGVLYSGFFQRLWDNLHADPSRLPYAWHRLPDGRLCCQLRPLTPEDRAHLEAEGVADRPNIELRILTPQRGTPELAEVVFPADTSATEAKTYLFQELQELAVQSHGRNLRWSDEPDRLVLWLDAADRATLEPVAIAPGVVELIGAPHTRAAANDGPPFLTYALAFDRALGWTHERAEQWAADHAKLRDSGRTAFLRHPHRMGPALARFVAGLLAAGWAGGSRPDDSPPGDAAPAVEFVPVPSLQADPDARRRGDADNRRRGGGTATAPRLKAVKGGAGLETELGDSPRPDSLPGDLREGLPAEGLVNYLEARAVIHDLEALAAAPDFFEEAERWQRAECGRHGRGPAIAVIALYPAQAELIRQMAARVPALAACRHTVEIGTPDQFRHRECLAALVSLTRSHPHRPVSFGEGPQALALAFTRARARLLVYGDPGTLARRCQCADAVDHLDAAAAARERGVIGHLVACIQGHGAAAAALRLRQGIGS